MSHIKKVIDFLIEKQLSDTNSLGQPISSSPEGSRNFWKWFKGSKVVDEKGRPQVVFRGQRKVPRPDKFKTTNGRATPSFTNDPHAANVYAKQLHTLDYGAGSNVMPVYLSIKKPFDLRDYGEMISLDIIAAKLSSHQDMIDILENLDDLIYKTHANYEIEADDGNLARLTSFEEVAEHISDLLYDEDNSDAEDEIVNVLSECRIDTYLVADSIQCVDALSYVGYDGIILTDVFDVGEKHYDGDKKNLYHDFSDGPVIHTYRPFEQTQVKSIFNVGSFGKSNPHISESI